MLARPGEHVGQDAELVAHERIAFHEVALAGVAEKVARGVVEGEEVLEHRRLLPVLDLEGCLRLVFFGEDALLDDLVHVARRQREPGVEASLDLGEVHADDARHRVDSLLAGDDDPDLVSAVGAQILGQRLHAQHEAAVRSYELAYLVGHEQKPELAASLRLPLSDVLGDLLGEGLRRDDVGLGAVEPVLGGVPAHPEHLLQGLDHLVLVERPAIAVIQPLHAAYALEGRAELLGLALLVDESLELGELEVLAVETPVLVEHPLKRA